MINAKFYSYKKLVSCKDKTTNKYSLNLLNSINSYTLIPWCKSYVSNLIYIKIAKIWCKFHLRSQMARYYWYRVLVWNTLGKTWLHIPEVKGTLPELSKKWNKNIASKIIISTQSGFLGRLDVFFNFDNIWV